MSIYSFLIAVRSEGQQLMSESGETTSHLMGMFYRTLRMVDNGIKPLYVFDGAPPKLKSGELAKRGARKAEATEAHEEAKETGTAEDMEKFSRRTVRATREHSEECKKLLKLMGVPYIDAPTEAEAQCAALARAGKVYAAASEDMDTLCFETPILLRHLTFSEQRKEPIQEIHLDRALEGLNMDRAQVWNLSCGFDATHSRDHSVHRFVYPSRLRLPRAYPQGRSKHRPWPDPRTQEPREGARAYGEGPQEEVCCPGGLALSGCSRPVHCSRRSGCGSSGL